MPLESVPAMMRRAREGGYAIGYFESWNLESLYGVVEAAEQARAPVIIGYNGTFLSRPKRTAAEGIVTLAKNRPFSVDFAPTSRAPSD